MNINRFIRNSNVREILFVLFAMLFAIGSIIYSNFIANQIEENEKTQVLLWAKAVSQKARIIKKSKEIFTELAEEERKKVELNAKATQLILSETDNEKLSFFLDIIKLNDQIPTVSTDQKRRIIEYRNTQDTTIKVGITLDSTIYPDFFQYKPIEVKYEDKTDYIYYKESNLYKALENAIDMTSSQFLDEIKNNASNIPTVIMDEKDSVINYGHLPKSIENDSLETEMYIAKLRRNGYQIPLNIDSDQHQILYYENSNISSYIKWFPIFFYLSVAVFLVVVFYAVNKTRKYEKNQIWVGMAKETAHQLGTPLSSISAWLELQREDENASDKQKNILDEMQNDVSRLNTIADRFSKIGSKPQLEKTCLNDSLQDIYNYLKPRASKKIELIYNHPETKYYSNINNLLFEWVIENLVKNAFDSIQTEGTITIELTHHGNKNYISVIDSGKGIAPKNFEKIFEPGFTTKKRGWGLGLSLCKRIIEEYFGGKIGVKSSKPNVGTNIQIVLDAV